MSNTLRLPIDQVDSIKEGALNRLLRKNGIEPKNGYTIHKPKDGKYYLFIQHEPPRPAKWLEEKPE